MSQPRRRRRRRRRGGQSAESQSKQEPGRQPIEGKSAPDQGPKSGKSRRRRGRGRTGGGRTGSPKSSEDLVRALPKERPEQLTAPPDGQTLEAVIGDLQSTWGVPPYPQEYRITLKVAEERDQRNESGNSGNGEAKTRERSGPRPDQPKRERSNSDGADQPRREKAPAAPGMGSAAGREKAPRKRRRRRRRGGGGGEGSSGPQGGSGSDGGPPREKA